MTPYFWLIKVISTLVPKRFRSAWKQEWEAELLFRESLLKR